MTDTIFLMIGTGLLYMVICLGLLFWAGHILRSNAPLLAKGKATRETGKGGWLAGAFYLGGLFLIVAGLAHGADGMDAGGSFWLFCGFILKCAWPLFLTLGAFHAIGFVAREVAKS